MIGYLSLVLAVVLLEFLRIVFCWWLRLCSLIAYMLYVCGFNYQPTLPICIFPCFYALL